MVAKLVRVWPSIRPNVLRFVQMANTVTPWLKKLSMVIGQLGLRGLHVVLTVVIIVLGLALLLALQTVDGTVWAEIH